MLIAVCIKQVPVVSALQFDPQTKTLKREGVRTEVSSFDVRALLKGLELRAAHGGEVVAVTMGPPQAREALGECLALGADRGVHLCDRAFAGAANHRHFTIHLTPSSKTTAAPDGMTAKTAKTAKDAALCSWTESRGSFAFASFAVDRSSS